MVFMKKGATPNKNQQQFKKGKATPSKQAQEFQDMDDSDNDVDSDDAPQLQKTPLNKGAKGRQSMSERKVSFSIPGKNSPAVKTPKTANNSTLAKKQPTPASKGKTSMQTFKGMKGKKAQADDDDEEDDDDEDDDDFEMDDDIELAMGDSADEDDDDDEEEDDDDDDEEDGDEEEGDEVTSNMKKVASPNEKSPKKEKAEEKPVRDDKLQGEILKDEAERRKERNSRMLYVGKLPSDVTEQELKNLSKDVVEVSIPMGNRKHSAKSLYAFLTFNTEAKADANHKSLQTKKFRGQPLTVDYVGEKSVHDKFIEESKQQGFNLKRLFVSGLSLDATLCDVAKHFKKAFQITFNTCPTFRSATIGFLTEEDAKAAYDASKDISVGGLKLTVLYSRQGAAPETSQKKNRGKRNRKGKQNGGHQNAKRMKTSD